MRGGRVVAALALGASAAMGVSPVAATSGLDDVLFPNLGSSAIDVSHYDLDLRFDPSTDLLEGTSTVALTTTERLSEVVLDSDGPKISSVSVNGAQVDFEVFDAKLHVRLSAPLAAGAELTVAVTYQRDTSIDAPVPGMGPDSVGWFNTPGGSYVLNEPDGMRKWAVVNDHPSDKATWTFTVTVPAGTTAVANGLLQRRSAAQGTETFVWAETAPMSTYLVQVLTGDYTLMDWPTESGPKLSSVAIAGAEHDVEQCRQPLIDQMAFFVGLFGPYPFDSYGIAATDSFSGLAMEQQTRSMFSAQDLKSCAGRVAQLYTSHELAHQWFGNAVSPAAWGDVWLNESFATYAQWLWFDHIGQDTLADEVAQGLARRTVQPTASPTVEQMFGVNSYDGGAVVLHALRLTIGDDAFFTLLKRWVAENRGTARRTADFIALAETVSGRDLTEFFDTWLFAAVVPTSFPSPSAVGEPAATAATG